MDGLCNCEKKWQLKNEKVVQKYCRENWERIGAYQERKQGPWHIPETACPPLTQEHLRDFLIELLKYQNAKHERFAMDPIHTAWCFELLEQRGYAVAFNSDEHIDQNNFLITSPHGWNLVCSTDSSVDVKALMIRYLPATVQVTADVTFSCCKAVSLDSSRFTKQNAGSHFIPKQNKASVTTANYVNSMKLDVTGTNEFPIEWE